VLGAPYPLRNLIRRWRGLVRMFLGVGIALGLGMAMLAMSNASVELFTADFRRSGADLYVVTEGGTPIPILPSDTPGTIEQARHTLAQIRAMPGVNEAVGVMSWSLERERTGPRSADDPTELVLATGVDGDPTHIPGTLDLKEGRWLRRADEVVLGQKLARDKGLQVGDTLRLAERDFTVVGIGKLRGFGFAMDAVAYLDMRAFQERAEAGDAMNVIAVDATDPDLVRSRIAQIGSLSAVGPQELVAQANAAMADAVMIRWVFSGLTLLIAALFVGTMLSRSVAARRLEFATLRAIGVPTRTVALTVGIEAATISVVAAALGFAISTALGWTVNHYVAPLYQLDFLYVADAQLFALVAVAALGLGVLAGWLPARRATRVDPVVVLREA
jgi:ABC-type lipoprotein release transport system permease subunit